MAFVVGPSRNPIIQAAYASLRAAEIADKKASKSGAKPEVALSKEKAVQHEGYRRLVASMPCKHCHKQGRSQAAHPPPTGKAIKRDDRECFPLCCDGPGGYKGCHPKFDSYQIMPHAAAVKQGLQWAAETRAEIIAADEWPKRLPRVVEAKPAAKKARAK